MIRIERYYGAGSGIEAVYLLGTFGVYIKEGTKVVLDELPQELKSGDIVVQGLPFYSGGVIYRIPNLVGECIRIGSPEFEGACLVYEGKDRQLAAWPPYDRTVEDLTGMRVELTRRNTFGPLHRLPGRAYAYGPETFLTEGQEWQDSYVLLPQGLMESPRAWRLAREENGAKDGAKDGADDEADDGANGTNEDGEDSVRPD